MKLRQTGLIGCILLAVLGASLAGCAGKDAASFVASAKAFVAKGDYKSAIIELKNALQKDPDNGEARVLMAVSFLQTGDAAGAETEIRKAIARNAPGDQTYPVLAQALAMQGQFGKVVSETGNVKLTDPAARSDLNAVMAFAFLSQGNTAKAKELLDAALADRPGNVRALLLEAQLAARGDGGLESAMRLVESALKGSPNDVDALMMKAEIEQAERKPEEARKTLDQAVDAHPDSIAARSAVFSFALKSGNMESAKAQVARMKDVAPNDVRTVYSDALLSSAEGNNAHAHDAIQRVLAARPDHLPSLYLSGVIDYQLGSYASAEEALRKVVARFPEDAGVRRILTLVYLRTGRGQQALDTLSPALKRYPDNPVLLRTAGEVYLASGNTALAETSYERANAIDKGDLASQVRLAQVRLAGGDTDRAINDLESLATHDSSAAQADLALFSARMQRHEYDKALAAVDVLEEKYPKSAFVPNLRGTVYLAKRDLKAARASFEKALALQSDFVAAARNLAIIDMQEGNIPAARKRYDAMLAKNPKNEILLLSLAELQTVSGDSSDRVKETIDKAIAANPTSVGARLALIRYEARQHQCNAAIAAAQSALAAVPDNPQLTEALASTQLMAGETNQAIETFKKLVQLQPQNSMALLRLAEAQVALKDYPSAIDNERKALVLQPESPQATAALAKTYIASGRADSAIAEARKMQGEHSDKAVGYALEGDILATQQKWSEAASAFKAALDRQPVPGVAARYYIVLQNAGRTTEAVAMTDKWMAQNPKDPTIPLFLAEQHQQHKELPAAKTGYLKVLDIDSNNIVALNNLAWILGEEGDAKALEYAERANRIAPLDPHVLDTYGWVLARGGQQKRATEVLRMATRLAPGEGAIRLHLAKALIQSGDKTAARQELSELAKLDKASPIRAEAEKLQASL